MTWTRSARCEASGCAEAARFGEHVHMRFSRREHMIAIADLDEWEEFVAAVKRGDFDSDKIVEEAL